MTTYDALVLTGGRARRLGGVDKATVLVGGRTLGARVAAAAAGASRLIVVGPVPPDLPASTLATREDPPGGGPVAAVAAGLALVDAPEVVLLAADLPFVSADAIAALRRALADAPAAAAAVAVDAGGRDQPLCSAWRADALRAALAAIGEPAGAPMHRLLAAAEPVVRVPDLAPDGAPPSWFDCDTPEDLATARRWAHDERL